MENSCVKPHECDSKTEATQTVTDGSQNLEENINPVADDLSESDSEKELTILSNSEDVQQLYEFEARALDVIKQVLDSIDELRPDIDNFSASSTDDKDYKYLEEMLIRGLVTLDGLQSHGNMVVKQERKRAVQYIQKLMKVLDARLRENQDAMHQLVDSDGEL